MSVSVAVIYHLQGAQIDDQTKALIEGIGSERVTVRAFDIDQALANLDALDVFDGFVFSAEAQDGTPGAKMQRFMRSSAFKIQTGDWLNKTASAYTRTGHSHLASVTSLIPFSLFCARLNMVWITPEGVSESSLLSGHQEPMRHCAWPDLVSGPAHTSPGQRPFCFGRLMAQATKRWCNAA